MLKAFLAKSDQVTPDRSQSPDAVALGQSPDLEHRGAGEGDAQPASSVASNEERLSPAHAVDSGWRPWSVVVGSFCLTVATYGLLSSIGLFQTYWLGHQLSAVSSSDIAWIPAVFGFLDAVFDMPAGILYDAYGASILLPVASVVYLASFVGLAFSATYSQFMACFVVAGVSAGKYSSPCSLWGRRLTISSCPSRTNDGGVYGD
jgi:hypothetical protein